MNYVTLGIFVILTILGTILNTKFKKIPAALFQIILGAIIFILPVTVNFDFESEAFMMFVIAPLLFTDGFNSSRKNLWLYKKPILYMAVLLVLTTVFFVGFLIHIIIPQIPFAASFALAAILSPTDAVAVKSITKGMKLPKGLMAILEGESLLNDAAGLVSFNIAIAAILTNTFSLAKATQNFLFVAGGGAILGTILGLVLAWVKVKLGNNTRDEANVLVIFQLLTPIFVFYIAEHFHVSGIVAVVICAIIYNFEKDLYLRESLGSESALLTDGMQFTVGYILNGFVFVILGYLLPDIYITMFKNREINIFLAFSYSIIIALSLMLVRFLFVYFTYMSFQQHNFSTAKKIAKVIANRKFENMDYTRFEYSLIASFCGIHGTVTMATALMIPVYLVSGENFPLRNTILFIASTVVLLSIILAMIFLPIIIKSSNDEEFLEQTAIRKRIARDILNQIKERDVTDKSLEIQTAYSYVIKDLTVQLMYFTELEKNSFTIGYEISKINKKIIKAENEAINKILENCEFKNELKEIIKITQLNRSKLISYSLFKQIVLQFIISYKNYKLKRLMTRYYVTKNLYENLNDEKFVNNKSDRFLKHANKHVERNKKIALRTKEIRNRAPKILEKFNKITYYTIIKEAKGNELATEFIYDIYKNFSIMQFQLYTENINFSEELKELQMEVIRLQKYEVLTMRKLKYISEHDEYSILRDLNYNESMIFPREHE